MKRTLILVVIMLLVASPAFAGIASSKHDLSVATGPFTGGLLSSCQYCHTPHNAVTAEAPLWNKTLTTTTFTLYGGGSTLAGSTVNQPGANSLTCLTCHDGTLNIGDVVTGTGGTIAGTGLTLGKITSSANLGTSLATTHPVGVVYDSTKTLAGLQSSVTTSGNDGIIAGSWKIYGGQDEGGSVECGSCHDPHETTNTPFLKGALISMCSDCHSAK